jgi:hypothetical protein
MPTQFHESNIDWTFADGWKVIQYDNSAWYRKHFNSCAESAAVDFIAVLDQPAKGICWLIEAKDFTTEPPLLSKELIEIISKKVRDTVAGVVGGAVNANAPSERALFNNALRANKLRVAFHCERPKHASRLFRSLPDAADLQQKLRKSLRAIDSKVLVLDCTSDTSSLPWTVTWHPAAGAPP